MKGGVKLGLKLMAVSFGVALLAPSYSLKAWAANPGPQSGSIGLQGTISTAPPSRGATIAVPGNGAAFTTIPVTVSGLCPNGLLVKVFDNDILVGATVCVNGSYSIQVDLFSGQNNLVTRVYDALDQPGPDSNKVSVVFNDAQSIRFGAHVSLSSNYAENGTPPGTELDWPILISGGTAPFALSVDWGDGSPPDLLSAANDGSVMLKHVYKVAGVYNVTVKATDKNGEEAFLQLVGQATGKSSQNNTKAAASSIVASKSGGAPWWSAGLALPLVFASFWVGRQYQLQTLRKNYVGKFGREN